MKPGATSDTYLTLVSNPTPKDPEAVSPLSGNYGATRYHTHPWTPLAGIQWRTYYYAGTQRIAQRTWSSSGNTLNFLLSDHLGSTRQVIDADGSRVEEVQYKAWGETLVQTGSDATRRKYTGQVESEAGLYFYNARYYDPYITQFIQPDSIIPEKTNPQDWNRYQYGRWNPLKYKDDSGHFPENWEFFLTLDTFQIQYTIDGFGESVGIENLSGRTADFLGKAALALDITAGALDTVACATSTAGIIVGATSGAVITSPGGGTVVVGGTLGASVGLATAEIGNQVFLQPANVLATVATGFSVGSEILTGKTGVQNTLKFNSEGLEMQGKAVYGPSTQTGPYLTTLGWSAPISYLSADLQYTALLADIGVISPKPVYAEAYMKINIKENKYNFRTNLRNDQK